MVRPNALVEVLYPNIGEPADFLTEDVCRFFPHLMPFASIALVQSGDHILNTFDEKISECTLVGLVSLRVTDDVVCQIRRRSFPEMESRSSQTCE